MPAEKIGVYFDKASIGPMLKLDELAEFTKNTFGDLTPVVKIHDRLNTEEGRKMIQDDLESGAIDAVCVCGTTPRVDWDIFDFGSSVLVDRVNLREQVVLCYQNKDGSVPGNGDMPQDLRLMAQDYIKMGVTKLTKAELPEAEDFDPVKTILVLGGGWAGLSAALNAANMGFDVTLVEKAKELGGYAAKMYKTVPLAYPYTEAHDTGIDEKIKAVQANAKITVVTGATVTSMEGAPGAYKVALTNGSTLDIGSVVLATGWEAMDTKRLEPFGYGKFKNVVTSMDLETMAKDGKITKPSDALVAQNVVFILSTKTMLAEAIAQAEAEKAALKDAPGEATDAKDQPDATEDDDTFVFQKLETPKHVPFSSEVNTLTALKQARYVREFGEDSVATVFYDHMMVPGINERYYKAAQDEPGVMLAKGAVYDIEEDADGHLTVKAKDTLLGDDIEIKADMVVLPTAMVPTTALDPVINLSYRQGPAFPDLDLFDGFADSNYICFPYETRRTGIYAAGAVRQPMMMAKAEDDAAGAALKAIQCLVSADHGVAVHPRSGDKSYPIFNFMRCTQCKRCTEECPFGVLDDDEKGTPMPNSTRCRRCGTCMGACPERVISFANYNIDMIGSMIKQVEIPDNMEKDGPRVLVLACENDAYPAIDMAAIRGHRWNPYVRFVPVRCLGSVNSIWIADAMSKGTDGVMLLGCQYGDDYQCHFVKGSELCNRRMENIAESLNRLGVEPERVVQQQLAIDEYDRVPKIIDTFMDYIMKIGPNPFKGY